MIPNTCEDVHNRYLLQAQWTADLRKYLIGKSKLSTNSQILDVGCGTGALTAEIMDSDFHYHGVDINFPSIRFAKEEGPGEDFLQGDGISLPLKDDAYDIAFCHFVLMWVPDPVNLVKEMARVTKPGGRVIAFAEPDYGGRIDYPQELVELGRYQVKGLFKQGANPLIGREISAIFHLASLSSIQFGVLGGQWSGPPERTNWKSEWQVLVSDLEFMESDLFLENLDTLKEIDRDANEQGIRVIYVPTFYAVGVVN